jgi:glycosyltransferase involved in cell wall biosynthesis
LSEAAVPGPAAALEERGDPFVSLVVPVFNEAAVLPLLLPRLRACLDALPGGGEICIVDDGSEDGSGAYLDAESLHDPRITVVSLSRNFGHSIAITAGLDHARGDAVVVMDCDLQDPPELVAEMVALYRRGFDVVHARRRTRRGESAFKRLSARLFYWTMKVAAERSPEPHVGEFRLMSREVVDALLVLRERHRLVRGLVAWVGFRQTVIDFERPPRAAGTTKYPLVKMFRLAWDGMTSLSAAPLRLATLLGFAALLCGIAYAAVAVYVGYVRGLGVPGWTSLVIVNIFFSGVVLICLGLVGEYVAHIFDEVKGRPLYYVRRGSRRRRPGGSSVRDTP